jgi:hypothetical protein
VCWLRAGQYLDADLRRSVLIFSRDGIEFGRGDKSRQFVGWNDISRIALFRRTALIEWKSRDLSIPYFMFAIGTRAFLEEIEHYRPDLVADLLKDDR